MLEYQISAQSKSGGAAYAEANHTQVYFDGSADGKYKLPNPTELLLTSLAACMLKNVERFSEILKFEYTQAVVDIIGVRNDKPPFIAKIEYSLKVESEMDENMLNLLHKNILKFGTITNTLAKSSELTGTIQFLTSSK